jgi:hypothetical protein
MAKLYQKAKVILCLLTLIAVFLLTPNRGLGATPPAPTASPSPALFQQSSSSTAIGHALGGSFQSGLSPNVATASSQQVITTLELDILGAALQALSALTQPPNTINGTTYTEFYSFGKRVFSQDGYVSSSGDNQITVGLAPAEIRVPLVIYPIGPVVLEIDGGARFQANLQVQSLIDIGIPISLSQLGIQLQAVADGAGFIEGYVSFLVIRAGVGGQVNLVDANANVNAEFSFNGIPPYALVTAMVDFLSGQFYAFVDYFSIWKFGWYRLLNYNLYSWKGFCFATGGASCS